MTLIRNPFIENYEMVAKHCILQAKQGVPIEEDCARAICNVWHNGQSSAFYSFTSSGHFDKSEMIREIDYILRPRTIVRSSMRDLFELNMLREYIESR